MTNQENDKKQFDSEDIRRYISGEMSEPERHALEKRALEDPFLADAIEGMESRLPAKALTKDLERLQERLEKRLEVRQKGIVAPFYKVAAAAILFLMAGSLSILYFLNRAPEAGPDTVAKDLPGRNSTQDLIETSPSSMDSTTMLSASRSSATRSLKAESPVNSTAKSEDKVLRQQKTFAPLKDEELKSVVLQEGETDDRKAGLQSAESMASASMMRRKPDTLKSAAPSLPATVKAASGDQVSIMEMTVDKKVVRTVPEEIKGRAAGINADAYKDTERIPTLSVQPLDADSADFGPLNSWNAYAAELNAKLKSKTHQSEAVVQFRINRQGQPQDLRILRTQDQSKSAEIIRFIQNAHLWQVKPGTDSTVKVLIRF